jgi:heme-degrading monooxygenase HmoA
MKRIVRMTFREEAISEFLSVFRSSKPAIEAFDGCHGVSLLRGIDDPRVFFTLSDWDSTEHLDKYRNSMLFKEVWSATKSLFAADAEAWSTELTA